MDKKYGGTNDDEGNYVQQTQDSGYVILGTTQSFGSGIRNAYLIKTFINGDIEWTKTFTGNCPVTYATRDLLGKSLKQTDDGGYILLTGAEPTLIRTNSVGDTLWTHSYHGLSSMNSSILSYHYDNDIQITNDSGYIVAGVTKSFGDGDGDVYIIKLDNSGNKIWEKIFGGSSYDSAYSIQPTKDGGYIAAGATKSYGAGNGDIYILKINAAGNKIWDKTLGGNKLDIANDIKQTSDGGYILAGETYSLGKGNNDIYVVKLDKESF